MSTAREVQIEEHKWIAFAHLVATGEIPISNCTLERIAKMQQFDSSDRLLKAEKHLRHTIGVLLEALDSSARGSIIQFFERVYKHERKT
jgi:hypothetical protein